MNQNLLIHRQNFFQSNRKSSIINFYGLKNILIFLTLFYSSCANAQQLAWREISSAFERQYLKDLKKNVYLKCVDCYSDLSERDILFQRQILKASVFIASNNRNINITTVFMYSIVLILIIAAFLFYHRKKHPLQQNSYDHFTSTLKIQNNDFTLEGASETQAKYSVTISEETSNAILKKIIKFENSEKFLRKDINLTWLSSHLNTNTKYLSEVIKIHRDKNFNSYINGLRISYITKKLYEDSVYREYKISYLSEECGYASPQVFVIAFKKETDVTPSCFIERLKSRIKDETETFYELNDDI